MRHTKPDDLDWLAFCYIADELSPDEREAFESQLANDQGAREAVARAVDLTRAVAAVDAEGRNLATPASLAARLWRRTGVAGRLGWTAVAIAACLVVVLAHHTYRGIAPVATSPQDARGGKQVGTSDRLPAQLAVVWSRTREELAAWQFDDWTADSLDEGDGADESPPFPPEDHADEDAFGANTPPSWMLAAVRAVAGGPGAEDGGRSNPEEN